MVYILFADGFEEVEALTPCDYLRRAGLEVVMVSMNAERLVTGVHGIGLMCDVTADEALKNIDEKPFEMLIFPGGKAGVENLDADPRTDLFLSAAQSQNAFLSAICAGPSLLGKRGFLVGKPAVCYPGFESFLSGAEISAEPVVCSGRTITAKAAGVASEFAFCLIEKLRGKEAANQVKNAVFFQERAENDVGSVS